MPQPDSVERLTEELLTLYRRSWDRITRDEQAIINSWTGWRRAERLARIRDLQRSVEALMDRADEQALQFTQDSLPEIYLLGAAAAGTGLAPWAQPDVDAIGVLAQDTYSGLLDATQFVRASTKDLIRTLSREHIADKLIRGQTAEQAAHELAARLEGRGISAVIYKDGSRHGLGDYSDMLVRTKSAEAYSVATLTQLERAGIEWVEVFDGVGCGWTSHQDPDKANGTIRSVREAQSAPVSHPRCRRAFGGRPDIQSSHEAARARPTTTPEQQADQAEAEARRALGVTDRASRRSFDQQVQRRADALLSDASNRVRSVPHARVLARRDVIKARRERIIASRAPATPAAAASRLVEQAKAAEPRLTELATSLADANGGTMAGLDFRLKTEDSLTRRIAGDVEQKGMTPDEVADSLFDVNRYTTVFPEARYAESAQATLDELRAQGNTLNVKNYWNNADNPYQGINVQVTSPDGGQWELQFHTETSLDVKEGELHAIYEKSRETTDELLLRRYTAESFDVAGKIPVPAGVQSVG